tara:strand:+ start:6350 stop:7657 length:1308 start_codon:yes stop_codon:yes gene_type:complete
MINNLNNLLVINKTLDLGQILFFLGVFFLPTALPISGIFILISLIISILKSNESPLEDRWNLPVFISIGLIIFSSLNISLINTPIALLEFDKSLIWINLFNWIPIFIGFWGFQTYLKTSEQRITFAKYLLAGSIPVLFSCIIQNWFEWHGPHQTLNGLIVWFQKPIRITGGTSGLFSNPNYAGIWLSLILPFSLSLLHKEKTNNRNKFILLSISSVVTYLIFLTNSRNAFFGFLISILFIYGIKKAFLTGIICFIVLQTINAFIMLFSPESEGFISFIPLNLISKISEINFGLYNPRIIIWRSAIYMISQKPIWGWGASTFSFLYLGNNSPWKVPYSIIDAQHSHNIALELAHNFGIPTASILIGSVFFLFIKAWRSIFFNQDSNNHSLFNKAWLASSAIVIFSHMSDITYYDGKISLIICILFSGLRCLIRDNK